MTTELFTTRRSVKKYTDRQPTKSDIQKIVEAGTFAPTGRNAQSPIILAVTNKAVRDQLSRINAEILGVSSDPFYGAPVVLVVLARKSCPTRVYDGSLVMGNLMMCAHALGLGSCWIHRARETFETPEGIALLRSLSINDEYEGIGNCIIGYAAPDALKPQPPRKPDYITWVE